MVTTGVLKKSAIFAELGDEELQKIVPPCRAEHYDKGQFIFSGGEEATTLYILQDGKVELQYEICPQPDACQDTTILVTKPGDIICWSALVKPRRLTASAYCVSDVQVIAIDGKALNRLMEQESHIGFVVMKELAGIINQRLKEARGLKLERTMGAL